MPTTTNYGWTTPADTDLVKDGASAIRTLGTAIDTTVFNNAGAAIAKTIVDAKGDLIVASGADAVARLAVGTNNYVLTADSTATNGVKWAAPSSGGFELLSTTSLSGTTTTISTISQDYDHLLINWTGVYSNSNGDVWVRFNSDTGNNYSDWDAATYTSTPSMLADYHQQSDKMRIGFGSTSSDWYKYLIGTMWLYSYNASGVIQMVTHASAINGTDQYSNRIHGRYNASAAISSITFFYPSGTPTFQGGTVKIWGVK